MPDRELLQDWKHTHEILLQKERLMAAKAVDYALGRATAAELDAVQLEVRELRVLADAVFERVFELLKRHLE